MQRGEAAGIDALLQSYGGMGSLNDLVLGQTSHEGVFAWKPGYQALNERFTELRGTAWALGQKIRHSPRSVLMRGRRIVISPRA